MKLFEFEGKELFGSAGILVPEGRVVESEDELKGLKLKFPVMVKAQVAEGRRGRRGLVVEARDNKELVKRVKKLLGGEVERVLVEEKQKVKREYFVAITYTTKDRGPVGLWSEKGGVEVESAKGVTKVALKFSNNNFQFSNLPESLDKSFFDKLLEVFVEQDLFLAEINPLAELEDGRIMALDAKVILDDAANFRRKNKFEERNLLGKTKTKAEKEAEKIDAADHRGVVGRVYVDLEGDIGVVAAGGGASLVAMDALVTYGGRPANYTEFSGNPPAEKVAELTKIVVGKRGLRGAMLVGGKANFTDQYETLKGFLEGLRSLKEKPKYPIVVRRDGPRIEEAFVMLGEAAKKEGFDFHLFDAKTPIVEAVKKGVELMSKGKYV